MQQQRTCAHALVTLASGTALSEPIDMRQFNALQIHMPAAWTAAALGFHVGPVESSTYGPLYVVPTCSTMLTVLCQVGSATAGSGRVGLGAPVEPSRRVERQSGSGSGVPRREEVVTRRQRRKAPKPKRERGVKQRQEAHRVLWRRRVREILEAEDAVTTADDK